MSVPPIVPPIVTQYGGPTPYKMTNLTTNINVFNSVFYPNQIGDLAIWLDGKDILNNGSNNPADGTSVSAWINKAANLIEVKQTNATYQPVYSSGGNSVVFSNDNGLGPVIVNGLNTTYSSINPNETIFILFNNTITKNNYNLLYPELTGGRQLYLLSNTVSQTILTTAKREEINLLQSGNIENKNDTLITTWRDKDPDGCNVNTNHYINGLLTGGNTTTAPYTNGGDTLIGTDNYVGNKGFNGSISEIIIYSNALSDSDRQKVESYLRWKWNNFSLDPSNPYSTEPYTNYTYPNIDSNLIPAVPRNLFSGQPPFDSNNYPLIKNFIELPNRLRNLKF